MAASTSVQNSEVGPAGYFLSRHQSRRLKAASLAASIYGKSSIYPSTNILFGSTGYSSVPQINIPDTDAFIACFKESIRGESACGQLRQHQFALSNGFPHALMPSQVPGSNFTCGGRALGNSNVKIPGAHEASI